MRPIFFLEVFNPPQFLDLFRAICFLFCFVVFFLSAILTISGTIFSFADYITMKSKLACLPNLPPSPIFPSSQSPTPGALSTPACVHRPMKPNQWFTTFKESSREKLWRSILYRLLPATQRENNLLLHRLFFLFFWELKPRLHAIASCQ